MNENNLKKIFEEHKDDVPDNGFTNHLIRQLPERNNIFPQIVMVTTLVIGLTLMFSIFGFNHFLEQINSLLISVSQQQMPPMSAIFTYLIAFALTGFIGFSVAGADVG